MCEFLLGVVDIVLFIAVVIDCLPKENGTEVSNFVKIVRRIPGFSTEKELNDEDKYRKSAFTGFLLVSFLVLGFNVGEIALLYMEKENHTAFSNLTYVSASLCVFAMLEYLVTSVLCVCCSDDFDDITFHRAMLIIYHIIDAFVDLTILIAGYHEHTLNDLAELESIKFAFFLYSVCDIVISLVNMALIVIFWCFPPKQNSVNPTSDTTNR